MRFFWGVLHRCTGFRGIDTSPLAVSEEISLVEPEGLDHGAKRASGKALDEDAGVVTF
jgi:hypothetical protein